jgi:hypothetical protein
MASMSVNFPGIGALNITLKFTKTYADYKNKKKLKEYLKDSLAYIYQSQMGRAILQTVKKGNLFKIEFTNTCSFNDKEKVVKWDPLVVGWFADCTRARFFNRTQPMEDPVRPPDVEYTQKNLAVLAPATPAALLFHELGHAAQFVMRPHAFSEAQKTAQQFNKKSIFDKTGKEYRIQDLDWPVEVENVSWHEQPFIRDLWKTGITEGIRWHYQHFITEHPVDDWKQDNLFVKGEWVKPIRLMMGGNTYIPAFWTITDTSGKIKKQTFLKKYQANEKTVNKKFKPLKPPENTIEKLKYQKIIPE